jgi:hypothetical protein
MGTLYMAYVKHVGTVITELWGSYILKAANDGV